MSIFVPAVLHCDGCGKTDPVMARRRATPSGVYLDVQLPVGGWRIVAESPTAGAQHACSDACHALVAEGLPAGARHT